MTEPIANDVNITEASEPIEYTGEGIKHDEPLRAEVSFDADLDEDGHEKVNEEAQADTVEETPITQNEEVVNEDVNIQDTIGKTEELFESLSDDGLNLLNLYETEYVKNGEYSEATYKALEAKGWSKEHINVVSDAIEITVDKFANRLVEYAGGKDEYKALQSWSKQKENVSDAELKRYNDAINKGDLDYAKLQLEAWRGRYEKTKGTKPRETLQGIHAGTPSRGVKPFGSVDEQSAALNDPRYRLGGDYQREVQARMLASNFKY